MTLLALRVQPMAQDCGEVKGRSEGAVGGIFASGEGKLLDGLDGVFQQCGFPACEPLACPVAIDAFDAGQPECGYFFEQPLDEGEGTVVSIDEDSKLAGGGWLGHKVLWVRGEWASCF